MKSRKVKKKKKKKKKLRRIPTITFFDTVFGMNSDILSEKIPKLLSDIVSGILSDIDFNIQSDIYILSLCLT